MKKKIRVVILFIVVILCVYCIEIYSSNKMSNVTAIVIDSYVAKNNKYKPIIEDDVVYISVDDIKKYIDEYVVYDESTKTVVITTYDKVVKMPINEINVKVNNKIVELRYSAKIIKNVVYVPITEVQDILDIKVAGNIKAKKVVIDKEYGYNIANVTTDRLEIRSGLKVRDKLLGFVDKGEFVYVYPDALKHNRWYRIRTKDGILGYANRNHLELGKKVEKPIAMAKDNLFDGKKVCMFWQQSNNIDELGYNKIKGVNVVSPDWLNMITQDTTNIASDVDVVYLAKAKRNGYKVWPIVFNNSYKDTTSEILKDESSRETYINEILKYVDKYDFDGINIDFENLAKTDKNLYTQFIRELAPLMRERNKVTSLDIYMVEYFDKKVLSESADYLIFMGYDQHWVGSKESGSVAELSWVSKNISSLINGSKIKPEKIILGVPFYTRLWSEEAKTNETAVSSVTIGMAEAQRYIKQNNLSMEWLDESGQYYVEKQEGSITKKMWVEDAKSIELKVKLVQEYNIAGVAFWKKGLETQDVWPAIYKSLYE